MTQTGEYTTDFNICYIYQSFSVSYVLASRYFLKKLDIIKNNFQMQGNSLEAQNYVVLSWYDMNHIIWSYDSYDINYSRHMPKLSFCNNTPVQRKKFIR